MLVSYPKEYQKDTVYQNMISAMDILPTICREANVKIPDYIDGIDLTPLLQGENDSLQHDVLIWDTGHELAVRKGPWKLRKSFNDDEAKYEMVELELGKFIHNLDNDVGERTNLIEGENELLKELEKLYSTWKSNL